MNKLNRVIIFGATSDMAEQVARQLVTQGSSIYCIARQETRLEALLADLRVRADNSQNILGTVADLSDLTHLEALWQKAVHELGGVDAVLMAQGILPDQQLCQANVNATMEAIQINVLNHIALLTYIANDFEQQKSGVIAVISSVAGDRGRQSNYVYGASKGMLSLFLQGLRNRLYKSGVSVVDIKPGFTRTRMTAGMKQDGFLWANADETAQGIVKAMRNGTDIVYLKWIWRWVMLVIKHIPETIFKRLSL